MSTNNLQTDLVQRISSASAEVFLSLNQRERQALPDRGAVGIDRGTTSDQVPDRLASVKRDESSLTPMLVAFRFKTTPLGFESRKREIRFFQSPYRLNDY